MTNFANVVGRLRKERDRAAKEVERLDAAISALNDGKRHRRRTRKLSAAARARIAMAQKKRWAAWKAKQRAK
ncbi:MAG TPA: hypothetical protein VK302_20505 [Terriglobales bacterium]|nr:hypothetical protein [Terriglobales bacterium]